MDAAVCFPGCEEVVLCHLADIQDDGPLHFTCSLYPDTRVCGAYDLPLRRACTPVLPQTPQLAYTKKGTCSLAPPTAHSLPRSSSGSCRG